MSNPDPFELKVRTGRRLSPGRDLSIEETWLDSDATEDDVMDDERFRPPTRLLAGLLILTFGVLLIRLWVLQGVHGEDFRILAEGNKLRTNYILAPRGLIYDQFGKLLAGNVPSFELVVKTAQLPADEAVVSAMVEQVASILDHSADEIRAIVAEARQSGLDLRSVAQDLTKDQALILIGQQANLPGFEVEDISIRDYNDASAFAHLIGFSGKITQEELMARAADNYLLNDNIGKTGVERQYEQYLRGIPGRKQTEIDAAGNFKRTLPEVLPVSGHDLALHLDYDLQLTLYEALLDQLRRASTRRAAAVATNPQTGAVLAYVSLPSFDNNWFARGITAAEYATLLTDSELPLLDRVIGGTYPPGSTVKPILGLAALSEGLVTPTSQILDDGVIRIGEFTYYGYDPKGLGLMNIYSAIARSSDIYFYTIGGGNPNLGADGLGPDKLAEWLRKFQAGSRLGIDLPNEQAGLVPDPAWKQAQRGEPWYLGNTYHLAIGQGDLLATPLQVHQWTATLANGGTLRQPQVVDRVLDATGAVLWQNAPVIVAENFLDPQWVAVIQSAMRQAITDGSARSLAALPLAIAGKTGTAQFDSRNPNRTHAWFTSYAPVEDPQIALTILIEGGGEGSAAAVPVARRVYEWWGENRMNRPNP